MWVCDCVDNPVTAKFLNDVTRDLICNKCGSKLHEKAQLSLNEFIRLKNYKELFDDDSVSLVEGDKADFIGTNSDSINTMIAENMFNELEGAANKETDGDIKKYVNLHPEKFKKVDLDDLKRDDECLGE